MFNHDAQWATQSSGAPSSTLVPDRLTQLGLSHSDPYISHAARGVPACHIGR